MLPLDPIQTEEWGWGGEGGLAWKKNKNKRLRPASTLKLCNFVTVYAIKTKFSYFS